MPMNTLNEYILDAFRRHSSAAALDIDNRVFTYGEIGAKTAALVNTLLAESSASGFVGIFAARSLGAYVGVYATLLAGRTYMPLNPRFPAERLESMVRQSGCETIILSPECADAFRKVADRLPPLVVLCTDMPCGMGDDFPQHRFCLVEWSREQPLPSVTVTPETPAYLLFTSGSTGIPKGVPVSHRNVCAYLDHVVARYGVTPSDRMSQMFDMTFDLSVHDIFVAAGGGACLCATPERFVMAPSKFIREKELSLWFSVPSVAMFMSKMGMLTPGAFPSLRFSLFCGEALPERSARLWRAAAPNSAVENLYGPTEATIAITGYRWDDERSPGQCVNGVVPIGEPFPGHAIRLIDAELRDAPDGGEGELCLSGPQVTGGYLNNPVETSRRFVHLSGSPEVWYRTGDLARNTPYGLVYLGRTDDQVQIRGYRVELQEIDRVLREATGSELAVAVPVSAFGGENSDTIYGYVEPPAEGAVDANAVLAHCRERLPEYMAPSRIILVDKMPLNSNGKIDRNRLAERT